VIGERETLLRQVAPRKGSHLVYTYDFGDNWEHDPLSQNSKPETQNSNPDGVKTALAASKGQKVEANVDTGVNLIAKENIKSPVRRSS
jgi:hypothetical protein